MGRFKPVIYKKNIYDINYQALKDKGIKCLVFDLDNTLGLIDNHECPIETKKLLNKLKKDFLIYICSNNTGKRLKPYLEELGVNGVSWSLKPSRRGLRKIKKISKLDKSQMCIIGDQIVTDIFAGNRFKILTILVDPLGVKDLKITALNRIIENMIVSRYERKGIFKRGNYYE